MQRFVTAGSIILLNVSLVAGCATRGQLRRSEEAQRTALEAESAARTASEQQMREALNTLTTDVNTLRQDLESLRTEFGTQITTLQGNLQFVMPVHFGFNEAEIAADDHAALDRFAQVVQAHYPGSQLTVEGFADPAGSAAYNQRLSERRAEAVESYLLQRGLQEDRLRAVGYGESRPVVPGAAASESGAELNRRVVFVIEGGGGAAGAPPAGAPIPSSGQGST